MNEDTAQAARPKALKVVKVAELDEPVTTEHFVIVKRDEYHVALIHPIPDVTSTRNPRDRFTVTGFFIHAWRDSARKRSTSIQARKQRRVGVPHDTITTIQTDDKRVAAALRAAIKQTGA